MGRYVIRRLLVAIPTLIVISFVIYGILALAPIDPLSQFGADPRVPPEAREHIRHALGLDQPWYIRYVLWMKGMFTGDFGIKLRCFPFTYNSDRQVHDLDTLVRQLKQSVMPIAVLGLFDTAVIARYVRAEMLEHLPLDYVRTARGKGLMERFVVLRHVLRNSLIPVVTLVALGVPAVFGGAIVTEQVFRVPGIGELLVTSIGNGDIPVVSTVVFIFAVLVVAFNLM